MNIRSLSLVIEPKDFIFKTTFPLKHHIEKIKIIVECILERMIGRPMDQMIPDRRPNSLLLSLVIFEKKQGVVHRHNMPLVVYP